MIEQLHVDECDSTQDLLKEQLDQNPEKLLIVSCEKQTHGYGRGSNSWIAMPGTVCFSLTIQPHDVPTLTSLEMGVLIRDFFLKRKKNLQLKWPNDLFIEQKKCAGLIIQSYQSKFLLGVGINLFSDHENFGALFHQEVLFSKQDLSWKMANHILNHRIKNSHEVRTRWLEACEHLHKNVSIIDHDQTYQGQFEGIGENGEAILLHQNGELKKYYNGSLRI